MALTTDRISVLRGRPPVRAGGRRGLRTAHCWLVRSLGYGFGFIPFLRSRPPFWNRLLMGIVQLAESQGAIHAKTTQTGPDRGYPPRLPSRSRRRLEHQPCLPQGRDRTHHLLPLEGPPGGPRIE